jgi:hypothetical protein
MRQERIMASPQPQTSEERQELLRRVIAGCLGGVSVAIMSSFVNLSQFDIIGLAHVTTGYLVGLILRVSLFGFLGAMWVFQMPSGTARSVSFQLGMIPYLFVLLTSQNYFGKEILPRAETAPPSRAVLYRPGESLPLIWYVEERTTPSTNPSPSGVIAGLTGTTPANATITGMGFWIVFGVVSIFTLLSGIANVYMVVANVASTHAVNLIDNFNTTWKLGFGAIIGLIGGKAF